MKLFERSQIASRRRFSPPIAELKGKINEIQIPLTGRRKITAYDINPDNTDKYIIFFHGTSQNISNCQQIYNEFLKSKYAVLAPEYSGFGKNKTRMADEYTLEEDIAGSIRYLKKKENQTCKYRNSWTQSWRVCCYKGCRRNSAGIFSNSNFSGKYTKL